MTSTSAQFVVIFFPVVAGPVERVANEIGLILVTDAALLS